MKIRNIIVLLFASFATIVNAQTGPFTSMINKLQTKDIGNPYNTVFLEFDIVNSPCGSTNIHNRFTIINNAQHSTVLAAVMGNKEVTIYGTGVCNSANIEDVNVIIIKP